MSGKRKEIITTGEIYHVFNKTVANEEIFGKTKDSARTIELLDFYRFPQKVRYSFYRRFNSEVKDDYLKDYHKQSPKIELYGFAFMPNHFHLLLKQNEDDGIREYIANFENSCAKFHNLKYKRKGRLFLQSFKAKRISTDQELLHVSRYIHLNPATSFIIKYKDLKDYSWTSYPYYLKENNNNLVNVDLITKIAGSKLRYEKFVSDQVQYQRRINKIKHLILE